MTTDGAVFDAADIVDDSVTMEVANLIEDLAARASEGDELGDAGGIKVKAAKPRSMVRLGDQELPPRTRVYDRKGVPSDVPTAQLYYHLAKKGLDGERAFFARPPTGVTPPTPIDQTCEWCEKRAGRRVKVFYDLDDYEAHCENLHPREWASKLRREARESSVSNVKDILKLLAGLSAEEKLALIGDTP